MKSTATNVSRYQNNRIQNHHALWCRNSWPVTLFYTVLIELLPLIL